MILWEELGINELAILMMLILAFTIFGILAKRLPRSITWLSLLWGLASAMFFDFTIGGGLFDFYQVNDSPRYELFDLFYYILFAPFSYLFIYLYEKLEINKKTFVWYIMGWSIAGVGANWLYTKLEIIHFHSGYILPYSFIVFLIVQTITGLYYERIKSLQGTLVHEL
ncbi:hypothetical protein [Halalkalibacter okhensis]|uniref:Uncharacterized protein n=1 Tax=Halalkalibacter okhensis TaxID=333138 RepID=A0A0B0IH15_9BACI|nr:hypothetical protein [Halalkalibacter okhensis]KHF40610.1 hypothetical protein LQ50_08835 [Halalkalibacter okhensis]